MGSEGLPIPIAEPEDAVGFGDGVPSLEVGQGFTVGGARLDVTALEFGFQLSCLIVLETHD